jgi:hypothetical protein
MTEIIQIGDISIAVTRKDIKNVHLSVHPPECHAIRPDRNTPRSGPGLCHYQTQLDT